MKHYTRKPIAAMTSAALLSSLLFGIGAPSASAEDLLKITFDDVVSSHWARSNVAKLSSAGVIKGYPDGMFKPSQAVTQQEAIVMVLRAIGHYDDSLPAADNVAIGFEVGNFFKKFVVKAIELRIINLGEETVAEAASTGTKTWGEREATREWISKLVIRALNEQPTNGALTFADTAKVSAEAAGFVAKAVELGLVQGIVENNLTYFRPEKAVTRAEIVTFLSRADKYIPDESSRYASGFVTDRSQSKLDIRTSAGVAASFALNAETLVFDEEGKALSLSDVTNRTSVRVIHSGGKAYYIEVTGEAAQLESIEGELAALDVATGTIVLREADGSMEPYSLSSNAAVTNAAGAGISLSLLTEGSEVRLQRIQGTDEVTAVVLIEAAYHAEGTGIVQSVNGTANTVTFTDAKGAIVTYPVDAKAALTVKGQPLGGLAGLQVGDTFDYVIKDSVLTEIDITVQKFVTATGEYQGYAGNTVTILKNSTTPEAYLLGKNVAVSIEGLSDTDIDDLQPGDMVQLRISGSTNQVDRITVVNRNVTVMKSVTIREIAEDYILVRDSSNAPHLYKISGRSEFYLDGEKLPAQLYSAYLAAGRKVSLSVTSDQLVRLDIVTKMSGTVTAINPNARTITVRTADNAVTTASLASFVTVEVPQQTSASIADVTAGMKVQLQMGVNTDEIAAIQVQKSLVYTLTAVTAAPRTVYAKDAKGAIISMALDSEAKVLGKDGQSIQLSGLPLDQPILANYTGRRLVSVQEAVTSIGKVSTLDVTGGKLAITDFNKNVKQYSLSTGITVQKGTSVFASASALQLNDRVQLVVDAQGQLHVQVAQVEIRKFTSYDAVKHEVTLKIVKVGDQNKFPLAPNVYVHAADDTALTLNRLRDSDQVTVYLLGGKIIELVK